MTGKRTDSDSSKGSWEEARLEYEKWWRKAFRIGFPSFDWEKSNRISDLPSDDPSIRNARTSFRTIMTFLLRKRLDWRRILRRDGPDTGEAQLFFNPGDREEEFFGNQLLAEFLYRFAQNDEKYFRELDLLRNRFCGGTILDFDKIPTKAALYLCAFDLREESGRDPSRDEVLRRLYAKSDAEKHKPNDPEKLFQRGDLFASAKLAFLPDSRGVRRNERE